MAQVVGLESNVNLILGKLWFVVLDLCAADEHVNAFALFQQALAEQKNVVETCEVNELD